ncbi:hypothetical protein [Microbulbifer variabilis]|uniref:hypothetical protein n=1 Tax=Microbulbifer variabilis TaxID=266805 RepID=UPI001CFDD543|nr:hypothetical protein [Microbulbifer variabilis]
MKSISSQVIIVERENMPGDIGKAGSKASVPSNRFSARETNEETESTFNGHRQRALTGIGKQSKAKFEKCLGRFGGVKKIDSLERPSKPKNLTEKNKDSDAPELGRPDPKVVMKKVAKLGGDVNPQESPQITLANFFQKKAEENKVKFFVQGNLPSLPAEKGEVEKKGAGFNFTYAPKVGDTPSFDAGIGLAMLQKKNPDAVNCSTADGSIPFDGSKLDSTNKLAQDIKCNVGLLTYLQKLVQPDDYSRLYGKDIPKGAPAPITPNMHPYRFYASNFPAGSPRLKAHLGKSSDDIKNYFTNVNKAITKITNTWKGDQPNSIDGFLSRIYLENKDNSVNTGSWSPNKEDKYGQQIPSPGEAIDILKEIESEGKADLDNPRHMFALTLLQAQIESHIVHPQLLEKKMASSDDWYPNFEEALKSFDNELFPEGPIVLSEIPTKIPMYDTIPAFKLFNEGLDGDKQLSREKWVQLFVNIGVDEFIESTEDKIAFSLAWKNVFPNDKEDTIDAQWAAFNNIDIDHLTIIQDAPHDHDDQVAVAMAMSLKLRGGIKNLSIVEGVRNMEVAESLKTDFPRVYIDLCPKTMKKLRDDKGFRLLKMYPEDGLTFYKSEKESMPGPTKPSHRTMNEIKDADVAAFTVETFSLDDFAKGGKVLVIAPFSIASAVLATDNKV